MILIVVRGTIPTLNDGGGYQDGVTYALKDKKVAKNIRKIFSKNSYTLLDAQIQ